MGFLTIIVFIGVFYFVFANMWEQVCIAICPYGRLQGVLPDNDSINVIYDYKRGEPRGKLRKGKPKKSSCSDYSSCKDGKDTCGDQMLNRMETALEKDGYRSSKPSAAPASPPSLSFFETGELNMMVSEPARLGDCIDCALCVQVCPTGIDIRNGIQMECINCTACIDACDVVMDKIDRPRGLIRFDSENVVARQKRKIWTPRVMAYSGALLALMALNIFFLGSRDGLDVIILRTPGTLYQENVDGLINNLYTYQIINKTGDELPLRFEVVGVTGAIVRFIGEPPVVVPGEIAKGAVFIDLPAEPVAGFNGELEIEVRTGDELLETVTTTFLHPKKQ